jgi:hypothetical protein
MKTPFFITGLPRSRTAWLANLFTTDRSLCFHEPVEAPATLFSCYATVQIGISDSMLVLAYRELARTFPTSRWLYVDRDPNGALASFLQFTRPVVGMREEIVRTLFDAHLLRAHEMRADWQRVKTVRFEDLDDPATIQSAWDWCLPEVPFQRARWEILAKLRVEQILERCMAERGLSV